MAQLKTFLGQIVSKSKKPRDELRRQLCQVSLSNRGVEQRLVQVREELIKVDKEYSTALRGGALEKAEALGNSFLQGCYNN